MSTIFDTFEKKKAYLVCIDSDGCAMDTMDIKHFRCFGPCMVKEWGLEQWQEAILKRWNEINLYTMTRGINRFKGLILALQEINQMYTPIEDIEVLQDWVDHAAELSNQSLENAIKANPSIILCKALEWSKAVNQSISLLPDDVKKPFAGVKESLRIICENADVAIVSSANQQAIEEEWEKYGLVQYVDVLLSQNAGSKAFCIEKLLEKGYDRTKVLMIGDAPGDLSAATGNSVLYYPILVKKEKESWERVQTEALSKFLQGTFEGAYQEQLIHEFEENLK